VRHASDHFVAPDGLRLATRAWVPTGEPTAVVVLVHGFAEHVGRHEGLATALVRATYAVHGYDQRGHGYSPGERANVARFEVLLDDLAAFVREVRSSYRGVPLVILGHSAGGIVALRTVQEGLCAPHGLILSSPLVRSGVKLPRVVIKVLAALAGPFPRLPTVAVDPRDISNDPAEADAYRLDPAIYHGPAKGRIAREMVRHGEIALARAALVRVPTLLLQGTGDRICDGGATGELARALPDATLHRYQGGPHELFHDDHRERATADLLAWLQARLSADATPAAART
jgi:acylglycerol lipase